MDVGGLALLYASVNTDAVGGVLLLIALVAHLVRLRHGAVLADVKAR
jgi:hypothetical protein